MHDEPLISTFVLIVLGVLVITIVLKKLKQPYVVAYLLTGILLGPYGFKLIQNQENLARLGEIGVILLLFFAGMEVSPRKFAQNWQVPAIGTVLQILITSLIISIIGIFLYWSVAKIILFGAVVSLSSTAVVLKLINDNGCIKTRLGQNVLGILLVQDLAVVPLIIIIRLMGGEALSINQITVQILGGICIIAIASIMAVKKSIKISFLSGLGKDEEMRVFAALIICFGMSAMTESLELSSALGAFIGGMIVATLEETEWVANSLSSVKTIFMALFFISIGMLIDLQLLWDHIFSFLSFLLFIYFFNTVINALIFKALKQRTEEALMGGAMLSQIGEFSFVFISMGFASGIINLIQYNYFITLVSLSLLFSPLWISLVNIYVKKVLKRECQC
ncbi:MAG: cation:proton antiporter [Francisella sp.]